MSARKPLEPLTARIPLPLSNYRCAFLDAPFPLASEEYELMIHILHTMRPGIVRPDDDPIDLAHDQPGEQP